MAPETPTPAEPTLASAPSPSPSPADALSSPYPYAAAPDIIRAHQKDAYFRGTLAGDMADIHRRLLGARSAHAWSGEIRTIADTLYLSLTTLLGNRTLGEEYTDVVQIDASSSGAAGLPALSRRASYIAGSVLLPYVLGRLLPGFRAAVRRLLEGRLARLQRAAVASKQEAEAARAEAEGQEEDEDIETKPKPASRKQPSRTGEREQALWRYVLAHLGTLTSSAPVHALTLATFYFSGTYYELSKRVLGLRYVFTREVPATPDRAGYELLGLLLLVQLSVQAYMHVRHTLSSALLLPSSARRDNGAPLPIPDVSLSDNAYTANTAVLLPDTASPAGGIGASRHARVDMARLTHTPPLAAGGARYHLADEKVMAFVSGRQQRKCTLCLEEMRDPAATQCGHVFCWECIGDWVREKPECPLCRREAMVQHILPLRVA
ncbi:RING-1 like protein [Plectosphaerella plurivora]|uniref:RING-type E3 ubiquitin transferase n=1 Tax=Plectosphaerella plurivora TaxID=936078 RepID=A0A9P8VIG7_9PEZI|nr:RING-1 like protein [Plectosphaerella plurivora]